MKKEKLEKREECLRAACEIVNGARNQTYGDVEDNFQKIANLWSCYLGFGVGPIDVAMMMVLLKVARVSTGTTHLDNFVDVAGYAACAYEMGNDRDWEGESDESNSNDIGKVD